MQFLFFSLSLSSSRTKWLFSLQKRQATLSQMAVQIYYAILILFLFSSVATFLSHHCCNFSLFFHKQQLIHQKTVSRILDDFTQTSHNRLFTSKVFSKPCIFQKDVYFLELVFTKKFDTLSNHQVKDIFKMLKEVNCLKKLGVSCHGKWTFLTVMNHIPPTILTLVSCLPPPSTCFYLPFWFVSAENISIKGYFLKFVILWSLIVVDNACPTISSDNDESSSVALYSKAFSI